MDPDLIVLIGSIGATIILTKGSIFRPLRDFLPGKLGELVQCSLCSGWWIGFLTGMVWYWTRTPTLQTVLFWILHGAAVSLIAAMVDLVVISRYTYEEEAEE